MKFKKNDNGFVCLHCSKEVLPLGYTSRNHCPNCLYSVHVDIMPGDRENECQGLLIPINIEHNAKKGYVVVHKCSKCGEICRNKCAEDDDYNTILSVAKSVFNFKPK